MSPSGTGRFFSGFGLCLLLLQHIVHQAGQQFCIEALDHRAVPLGSVLLGYLNPALGLSYRRTARSLLRRQRLGGRFAVVAVFIAIAAVAGTWLVVDDSVGGTVSGRQ